MASAEGASQKFRVFCRTAAYDFFKFQGGGKCPLAPLRAPMSNRPFSKDLCAFRFLEFHNYGSHRWAHLRGKMQQRLELGRGMCISFSFWQFLALRFVNLLKVLKTRGLPRDTRLERSVLNTTRIKNISSADCMIVQELKVLKTRGQRLV